MDQHVLIVAIQSLFWITIALVVVYWPWQKVCVDNARDIIFEQRDIVFDLAAVGRLRFGSEPYETLRSAMNAAIRAAHFITFSHVVMIALSRLGVSAEYPRANIRRAISSIDDPETRKIVEDAWQKAEGAIILLLVKRSPPLMLVSLIVRRFFSLQQRASEFLIKPIDSAIGREIKRAAT